MLDLDVGADPRRGRSLARAITGRAAARCATSPGRDDPDFEHRLRGSIYGTTAGIGRMMDAIAAAAPAHAPLARARWSATMAPRSREAPPRYREPPPLDDDGTRL